MKKKYLLIILVCIAQIGSSQKCKSLIEISSDGKLLELPNKDAIILNRELTDKYSIELRKEEFNFIKNKSKKTLELINKNDSELLDFYNFLGIRPTLIDSIKSDLEIVSNYDYNKNTAINLKYLKGLSSINANSLTSTSSITYTTIIEKDNIHIVRTNDFKLWYNKYINEIFKKNEASINKFNLVNYIDNVVYLQFYKGKIDSVINELKSPKNYNNARLIEYTTELEERIINIKLNTIKNSLCNPWFLELAWINEGKLRLNPLDASSEEKIITNNDEAKEKARLFNEYIKHMVDWYIAKDTTGNIIKFKEILSQLNQGSNIYKPAVDPETKFYSAPLSIILPKTIILNKINLASLEKPNRNLFANKENEVLGNYFTRPEITENDKSIYIQNVHKASKIKIDTSLKTILDQSKFQENLGIITEDAATLGAVVLSLAENSGLLNFPLPLPNNNTIINKNENLLPTFEISGLLSNNKNSNLRSDAIIDEEKHYMIEVLEKLENEFIESNLYLEFVYNKTFHQHDTATYFNLITKSNIKEKNKAFNYLSETYSKKFKKLYAANFENYFDSVYKATRNLSVNLGMLCDVFSKSSLPHKLFDESDAKPEPLHQTKKIEVKTLDKPALVNVSIKNVGEKETKEIAKFKFRTGKAYRIQLGAGLAYTDWRLIKKDREFIQTTITENNGTIDIKNTYQPVRFVAGMHIQLGKGLLLQNNGFVFCHGITNLLGRTSIFIGVGVPKPLENIYTGLGLDLWPGLKATAGIHWYRNDFYTITNNKIVAQKPNFNGAPFIGINIDPTSLLKGLGVIKKLN
ncbi:MAG: hypothetical protein J0L69_01160 [Bacteroidetes bacterium]|nr:hypothetical protein [Bacteroidota bacterium]